MRCHARASLPVFGGSPATGVQGATSWQPPFMNRLYPAEARLKEGANARDPDQIRWEYSLAAGWWRPVSALPAVSRDNASMSTPPMVGCPTLSSHGAGE